MGMYPHANIVFGIPIEPLVEQFGDDFDEDASRCEHLDDLLREHASEVSPKSISYFNCGSYEDDDYVVIGISDVGDTWGRPKMFSLAHLDTHDMAAEISEVVRKCGLKTNGELGWYLCVRFA